MTLNGDNRPLKPLTSRQREVLRLAAEGRTNGEIAVKLGISLAGVKWHMAEIFGTLGVTCREDAIAHWKGTNSVRHRLSDAGKHMLGLVPLKWVAVLATTPAVLVAVGVSVHTLTAAPDVGTSDVADSPQFDDRRAEEIGRHLASVLALGPYPLYDSAGDVIRSDDLTLSSAEYRPRATTVATNVIGAPPVQLAQESRVWVTTFALSGTSPAPLVRVAFLDGTGVALAGGFVSKSAFSEWNSFRREPVLSLGEAKFGPVTFQVYSTAGAASGEASGVERFWWVDSRAPAVFAETGVERPSDGSPLTAGVSLSAGYGEVVGMVAEGVSRVRVTTADGQELYLVPAPFDGGSSRTFFAKLPDTRVVRVEALTDLGETVSAIELQSHPGYVSATGR